MAERVDCTPKELACYPLGTVVTGWRGTGYAPDDAPWRLQAVRDEWIVLSRNTTVRFLIPIDSPAVLSVERPEGSTLPGRPHRHLAVVRTGRHLHSV